MRKDGVSCYQRLKQYSHQVAVKHLCVKALACSGYFFLVEKKKLRFTFLGLVLFVQVVVQLGKALAVVSTHAEGSRWNMQHSKIICLHNVCLDQQSNDHHKNHLS